MYLYSERLFHSGFHEFNPRSALNVAGNADNSQQLPSSTKNRKFDKTNEMTSSTQDTSYADYYFGVLKNLNADSKLDLISQLSQSLKSDKIDSMSLESLFGAYKSEETADEIIAELRSSRVSNRNIEPL